METICFLKFEILYGFGNGTPENMDIGNEYKSKDDFQKMEYFKNKKWILMSFKINRLPTRPLQFPILTCPMWTKRPISLRLNLPTNGSYIPYTETQSVAYEEDALFWN